MASAIPYVDTTQYSYLFVSGRSNADCAAVAYRTEFEQPFSSFEMESWVVRVGPHRDAEGKVAAFVEFGAAAWFTGLWRSSANVVYVADASQCLHIQRNLAGDPPDPWQRVDLPGTPNGVWGLDDAHVYVWAGGDDDRMWRWDGTTLHPMPAPRRVSFVHGVAPDLLYAAGEDGTLAWWDGAAWRELPSPTDANITGLFVAGPEEIYAVDEAGQLLEGSSSGWAVRARSESALLSVAKWQGQVWLAGGDDGLLRLVGNTNQIEVVKPNVDAVSFDARGDLVMACADRIVSTADGQRFTSLAKDTVEHVRQAHKPLWQ